MGEITPQTAKFYIYPNFYPLRIKYFEKKPTKTGCPKNIETSEA
jgi:hypothetical protein